MNEELAYEKPMIKPLVVTDSPICNDNVLHPKELRFRDCPNLCCVCMCDVPCVEPGHKPKAWSPDEVPSWVKGSGGFQLSEHFTFRGEQFGGLLNETVTLSTAVLNSTGAEVVRMADGEHTTKQVADKLSQRYRVEVETVRADVEQFLTALSKSGIVAPSEKE